MPGGAGVRTHGTRLLGGETAETPAVGDALGAVGLEHAARVTIRSKYFISYTSTRSREKSMTSQRPELETRRSMLVQMRDNFRAQGFEAETNALALVVQFAPDAETKAALAKAVSDYETKSENCYKSAEAISAQLAKLPKPKKGKQEP